MSYFTDTIRALKSDGFIAHAKEYKDIRAKYYKRGSQIKRLERELAEARRCLCEAIGSYDYVTRFDQIGVLAKYNNDKLNRWRKAAGLTNGKKDKKVLIVNWEDK
jgi:hypothetical protein